ncbi:MAG: hypothetical protein J5I94_05195 [Phaeodactylibacter sp.]|nr:hypothetical protein [Phaeodactylibacter sp.]
MKMAKFFLSALAILLAGSLLAQQKIQNWRPYDKNGINVFEPKKDVDTQFEGLKVRIGGSFAQQYQMLDHSNAASFDTIMVNGKVANGNELYPLAPGFNLATANLYVDAQLADGIRVSLENYMSSRHHQEFWVKGGYIQIDKLPMFGNPDWFSENFRVKIGHFQVNYGDMQFRRSDNGNAMYNPFVGNYIMDAFATEIGGEVYYFTPSGLMAMVGATSGFIAGDITEGDNRNPSIYAKLAYDKQVNPDLRVRLSGSLYMNSGAGRNTLYSGDRAGSRFYLVGDPLYFRPRGSTSYATTNPNDVFTSGRLNAGFSNEVRSIMINPFIKFKGLELFGTFETSSGLAYSDPKDEGAAEPDSRTVTQIGIEGLYRFLPNEQAYIGARYNQVSGELNSRIRDANGPTDLSANRLEVAAGWYPIDNLLLKVSYVNQQYNDYPASNILHEAEFNGAVVEAVVGF